MNSGKKWELNQVDDERLTDQKFELIFKLKNDYSLFQKKQTLTNLLQKVIYEIIKSSKSDEPPAISILIGSLLLCEVLNMPVSGVYPKKIIALLCSLIP